MSVQNAEERGREPEVLSGLTNLMVSEETREKTKPSTFENARLRRRQLEKKREELMGTPHQMESEYGPKRTSADDDDEKNECDFQSKKARRSTQRRTQSSPNGQAGGLSSDEVESEESDSNSIRSHAPGTDSSIVREYFRSLAMPDVKPFDSGSGQKFEDFIRRFKLKFNERAYSDSDRREILAGYLEGEAKLHYRTLPKAVKSSTFSNVVRELKTRLRLGTQESRAEALREMRLLRKKDNQSVLQFCLELEVLSTRAHPSCEEAELALIRAEILHEQLREWPESYRLTEILASEGCDVYERMKEVACRLERIRRHRRELFTNKTERVERYTKGIGQVAATSKPQKPLYINKGRDNMGEATETRGAKNRLPEQGHSDGKAGQIKCTNCGKKGHRADDCWSKKPRREAKSSFSATVKEWSCKASTCSSETDGLIGPKHMVRLRCLGLEVEAMIDTGSQLTVMPLSVVLTAKEAGADLDRICKEISAVDCDVYDASGNRMDFLGCMETDLELVGGKKSKIQMHVKRLKDDVVLLGTNALEKLGVRVIVDHKSRESPERSREWDCTPTSSAAVVAERECVPPGQCKMIQVRCEQKSMDVVLWSYKNSIGSGMCSASKEGISEIPVLNNSDEPLVFKKGEVIGKWSQDEWPNPRPCDTKSDMLELPEDMSSEERMETLLAQLQASGNGVQMPERLESLIKEFAEVFAVRDQELTQTNLVEHDIDTGDTKPIKQKVRPVPRGVQSEFRRILQDLETRGIIERSCSDWASPVVLVQKKDKSLRLCIDYRVLNKHTRQDSYPLPTIDTVLQSLSGKKYFSTLDMASGYWQVNLSKDARRKSAFTTPEGLFEFKVLPFGLSTSPAVFQRLMDRVLKDLKGENVFVYIDDILVATEDEEKHYAVLREVFLAFRSANLKLQAKKCRLLRNRVAFLGHVLGEEGVTTDPDKIEKVRSYPRPTNISELRTFLGMCGYYRKFILNFSKIAKSLYDLTSSRVQYRWSEVHETAFENLKNAITKAPVLGQPDIEAAKTGRKPYIIYTDASTKGVGAVLCQEGNDKMLHPLYFASKRLSKAEERYHVTDLEALAIVFALRKFHFFVFGVKTVVRTDHQPLTSLFKRSNVSQRVTRWALEVQAYNIEIEYVKGDANRVADALSRGLVEEVAPQQDNVEPIKVVNAITAAKGWMEELQEDPDYGPIIGKVRDGQQLDEVKLPRHDKHLRVADFCIENDALCLILEDGSVAKVVPRSQRRAVFDEAHSGILAGHFNARKIFQKLRKVAFWEGMRQDITLWCRQCRECFLTNNRRDCTPPLKPIHVACPFEIIGVDVLEIGLSSSGMRYLVVIIDHFSKWLAAYPTPTKSAEDIAKVVFCRWICEGGRWPKTILSDQGREFENKVMEALCKVAGISQSFTKGYNPRENGVTERANQTILRMLKKRGGVTAEWDKVVPNVTYAYNVSPHSATGESPFFMLYGFDPVYPSNVIPSSEISPYRIDIDDYRSELMAGMKLTQDLIKENANEYKAKMKEQYDKRKAVNPERLPKVGERVFLKMNAEKGASKHPKLTFDWSGPYRVIEVSENSALISEIGGESEPLRVQHDLLRRIPDYIDNTPIRTKVRRKTAKKLEAVVRSVSVDDSNCFRQFPKQLMMTEDTTHPLHVLFQCHEKALAKPPGDFNGYRLNVPCPFMSDGDGNKLDRVLKGLPTNMAAIKFDNVYRLAQLVQVWLRDDLSEREKLMEMAKKQQDISAEALAVALLYYRENCLHFQLSEEKLEPCDFYHEHIVVGAVSRRMSALYQNAMSIIHGKRWEGPWERPTRSQMVIVPNSLENLLKWLPESVKGEVQAHGSIPIPDDNSDVVFVVGKEFAKDEEIMSVLRPWLERLRNRDVQLVVAIAPRECNNEQNIRAWNKVADNLVTLKSFMSALTNVKWMGGDALAEEWDNPIRCLGSDPYDENGKIGTFKSRIWYEKVRKFWMPAWPELKPMTESSYDSRKRRLRDIENYGNHNQEEDTAALRGRVWRGTRGRKSARCKLKRCMKEKETSEGTTLLERGGL